MKTADQPTRQRRFSLKPARLGTQSWRGLPDVGMGGWTTYSGKPDSPFQPGLLDSAFGNRCEYGALFTYLFRRFGLPNLPSDPYKDIADFALTTPLPDMLLVASPAVGDWPRLSLRFLVIEQTWQRLALEPQRQWVEDMVTWREAQGPLPTWMVDWLEFWRTKPGVADYARGDASDWGLSIYDMNRVKWHLEHDAQSPDLSAEQLALFKDVAAFADALWSDFKAITPHPAQQQRAQDWKAWPDSDPLKPYYAAAAEALVDLATPVRVRDSAINAHGCVSDSKLASRARTEPKVAGYGFGRYINAASEPAIMLLAHAEKLGNGDLKRGAKKLLAAGQKKGIPVS